MRNGPGSMATDLIPNGANSWVMASDSASTANLVAAYTPQPGQATKPPTDDRFTTRPDRAARMYGRTARVTASRPNTLTSKSARASASEVSSTVPTRPRPALLTRTSIRPNRSIAASTAARHLLGHADVEADGQQPVPAVRDGIVHRLWVAGGCDHAVAAGERFPGDLESETAGRSGDEPH